MGESDLIAAFMARSPGAGHKFIGGSCGEDETPSQSGHRPDSSPKGGEPGRQFYSRKTLLPRVNTGSKIRSLFELTEKNGFTMQPAYCNFHGFPLQ